VSRLRTGLITAAVRGLTLAFAPARARAPLALVAPRRILILKPCCFGDVVMATAAVAAVQRAFPDAALTLGTGAWSRAAVDSNPRLTAIVNTDPVGVASARATWRAYGALAARLRAEQYDAALVLDRSPLLGLLAWRAGIPFRAGLDSLGRGFALTHRVPCPPQMARNETAWYLDVVHALGVGVDPATPTEFYPTPADTAEAAAALAALGLDAAGALIVALHVGGGSNPGMRLPAKRWAPDRWAAVLTRLLERYPQASVLLLGADSAEDHAAAGQTQAALAPAVTARAHDLVGRFGWGPLGALAARCRLFLGPDTGATHLAVAAGAPVVAVFGPSDPRRYAPWDPTGRSRVVGGQTGGGDLAASAAALSGVSFHESVSVDEVWAAVQAALAASD
jgi:ADP-heptose:LPS heptosyltransferase